MDIIESYSRVHANLFELAGGSAACIFKALEQFNVEDRKEIASRLHEVLKFNFERYSVQDLVRDNLKALSPDADLSWIPDWRKDNEALLAST
jgi:hypothetical protein